MNAMLTPDETCAQADTIPRESEALNAAVTEEVRRKTRRLTIPEQDKLRAEIATLRSRVWKAFVAGVIVGFLLGVLQGGWLAGVV